MTLEEVAAELGVSRERARQIEARALAKLRTALKRAGLAFSDLCPSPPAEQTIYDDDCAPE